MENEMEIPWSEHTVIDRSELLSNLSDAGEWRENKIKATSFIVSPSYGTLDYDGFVSFLQNKFMFFALSEDDIEESDRPHLEAQQLSDYKDDAKMDGKWGELILFTMVEGFLDIPMMSHKLGWKQNPTDQVKGSDGLFFGKYEGSPTLGIGEAKMYTELDGGIKEALDSTNRFHGEDSQLRNRHELTVAMGNPSDNLSKEKIELLSSLFTGESQDYQMLHPIFVGYEDEELEEFQTKPVEDDQELVDRLQDHVEDTDLLSKVTDSLEDDYSHLRKHWLTFFFLPLEDKDRFVENIKAAIYPWATNH